MAKPGLIVVNTARGPIVDLDALAEALRAGRIGGAGLDVLPQEPADAGHPLIAAWRAGEPWVRRRLVLTPHAAFYSPAALEDMQRKSIEVCVAYLTRRHADELRQPALPRRRRGRGGAACRRRGLTDDQRAAGQADARGAETASNAPDDGRSEMIDWRNA